MLFIEKIVVPFVYVIDHGAVPVKFIVRGAAWPLQIDGFPLIVAVGNGFTIIVTQLVVSAH
jgi:hypothetical protein